MKTQLIFGIAFFSFLISTKASADCMAPFGVNGAMSVFTAATEVRYCDGNDWVSINNGASLNGLTGCSLVTASQGQILYSGGDYKFCYFNGVTTTARSIRSASPVLLANPDGIVGVAGKLYYYNSFKEPVFHNGISWYRTRPNPIIFTAPGTYTVRSPGYQSTLTIRMWGGGGGGGAVTNWGFLCGGVTCGAGGAGGASSVNGTGVALSAGGGNGGTATCNVGGTGGTSSGGGAGSANGANSTSTTGGSAPGSGGIGGVVPGTGNQNGDPGDAPGGGGSSNSKLCTLSTLTARGGGSGAYTIRQYTPGQVAAGTVLNITVGAGGAINAGNGGNGSGAGGAGRVEISWD